MHRTASLVLAAALAASVLPSAARAATTFSFEGFQDTELILNAYAGGTGSMGSAINNSGVFFDPGFFAGNDSDITSNVGFWGDTANEPDGMGSMYFANITGVAFGVINVPAGFNNQWSSFYSAKQSCQIDVWSGPNGSGLNLGSLTINPNAQTNAGDPNGTFTTWKLATIPFSGVAQSVTYTGPDYDVRFDRMDFNLVPAPGAASLALLGGLAALRRRR
ncbi:MAG: hypothetical protein U0638_05835 [Phycisphaerales bacterium]